MKKLGEKTEISMDIRTIIGITMVIISIAGTYFTLDAQVKSNRVEITRMKEYTNLNNEFRIKWPRGEMGALPDDAKQDLRISYLQKDVDYLRTVVKELEITQAKNQVDEIK